MQMRNITILLKKTKECVELEPTTYQHASIQLESQVEPAKIIFRTRKSRRKYLRNQKRIGLLAIENNPKNFQNLGKNCRYDDDNFDLAVENNGKFRLYAKKRHRNLYLKPKSNAGMIIFVNMQIYLIKSYVPKRFY